MSVLKLTGYFEEYFLLFFPETPILNVNETRCFPLTVAEIYKVEIINF